MYIENKYKPKTLKQLFHKNINIHIKKWLDFVCSQTDNFRHTLVLYGQEYSGKRTNINMIFKRYLLVEWNDTLVTCHCVRGSPIFQQKVFVTMSSATKTSIFEDIRKFQIDNDNNVPVIVITENRDVYDTLFIENKAGWFKYDNLDCVCSFFEYPQPSLSELVKLTNDICKYEKIQLQYTQAVAVVNNCEYNVNKIFNCIELLRTSTPETFQDIISELLHNNIRTLDQTVNESLLYDNTCDYTFDLFERYETNDIKDYMFQEYPNVFLKYSTQDINTQLDIINNIANISDLFSYSDGLVDNKQNTTNHELSKSESLSPVKRIVNSDFSDFVEIPEYKWVSCVITSNIIDKNLIDTTYKLKQFQSSTNNNKNSYKDIKKSTGCKIDDIYKCYDLAMIFNIYISKFIPTYERVLAEYIYKYNLYEVSQHPKTRKITIGVMPFRTFVRAFTLLGNINTFMKKVSKKNLFIRDLLELYNDDITLQKKNSNESKSSVDTDTFNAFFGFK